ncbi:MAG: asparagine synthase (glutamine-hydrolyzing) [Micropruina sp.]|nr:asparagine synthase (glutamine-hydrolyzing) [Micropruina sp.]
MCGICGIVATGDQPAVSDVTAMIGAISHRGPDGSGYLRDHHAVLGHARLAIIDTAGGAQPLCNEDGTVWVVFNGEIFNYVELRHQLRDRGHVFRTASDTEVIVHAWEEWGEGAFTRFNGQWAIALWERNNQRLILSRDRVGICPLYYRHTSGHLAFASEIKALFAEAASPRPSFDPAGLDQVLTYWSAIAPRTVFSGIEQLPPGNYAVFDRDGLRCEPYWQIEFPDRGREANQDLESNAAELRNKLIQATRLRFERSDVSVGAYLSGGLDSSVTTAAIRNFTDSPLATFSIRFADAEFDEGTFQHRMAAALGTEHHEIVISASDVAGVFPEVVRHAESPLLRAAPAPLFLLAGLARESGFKVVVTGEGADEVLGGYDIYREARVRAFIAKDPDSPVRARAVELLYPWMARNPGKAPAFARDFFSQDLDPADPAMSHRPRWNSTSALKSMLSSAIRDQARDSTDGAAVSLPSGSDAWDPLSRAQWLEMTTLLAGYILASQGDRMILGNSVEGRFPFLDPDVVDFANNLPARHKLFGLDEKFILKYAFADLVPEEIRNRHKQPYRAPDAASFFSAEPPGWVAEALAPEQVMACGVFDARQVAGLTAKARLRRGRFGNTDNMRMLAVLSTQLLYQQFIAPSQIAVERPADPLLVIDLVDSEREQDVPASYVRS